MNASSCPDGLQIYFPPICNTPASPAAGQMTQAMPSALTFHMVPLSPTATGLVLVLLSILLTTLLVSKPAK